MTGVLLAVPPADFVLHNSLFLVAHFHNGVKATQKPTTQHQNETLPQNGSRRKPKAFGHQ
jgi:hypothetical protein